MSWEGYGQALCEKGHQFFVDSYGEDTPCPTCQSPAVWIHWVDQTNGCDFHLDGTHDDNCPGHPLTLEVLTPQKTEECPCCHHVKVVEEATYKKPD